MEPFKIERWSRHTPVWIEKKWADWPEPTYKYWLGLFEALLERPRTIKYEGQLFKIQYGKNYIHINPSGNYNRYRIPPNLEAVLALMYLK